MWHMTCDKWLLTLDMWHITNNNKNQKMVSVLLSAAVERFGVSHMQDFFIRCHVSSVRCQVSGVLCQVSCVTCCVSPVTCDMSLTSTATATDTANSPCRHIRMLHMSCVTTALTISLQPYLKKKLWEVGEGGHTDTQTHILRNWFCDLKTSSVIVYKCHFSYPSKFSFCANFFLDHTLIS